MSNLSLVILKQERKDEILSQINERKAIINDKNRNISSKSNECDNLNREKNTLELKIKEQDQKKLNYSDQLNAGNDRVRKII